MTESNVMPAYSANKLRELADEIMTQCKEEAKKASSQPEPRKLDVVVPDEYLESADEIWKECDEGEEDDDEGDDDELSSSSSSSSSQHHYGILLDRETEVMASDWFEPYESEEERAEKKRSQHQVWWKSLFQKHPFLKGWRALLRLSRFYRHLLGLKRGVVEKLTAANGVTRLGIVHPKYNVLTRNGRTNSYGPNIQMTPVSYGFREMFVSPPGYVYVTLDYSCIELCTLAAVCKSRYGFSKLGDVISSGIDPHSFTASMLVGCPLEEFMRLRSSSDEAERRHFQVWRQKAKAINFGIPGGLKPPSLRDYAQFSFGVEMSMVEARELRNKFITEVYPEIGLYLENDTIANLARNTCNGYEMTWRTIWSGERSDAIANTIRQVVRGRIVKRNGEPYKDSFVQSIWAGLRELCSNTEIRPSIARLVNKLSVNVAKSEYTDESLKEHEILAQMLFNCDSVTLCGRVRGLFTNTSFHYFEVFHHVIVIYH